MASDRLHITSPHSCTHLWHNVSLPEFRLIKDSRVWSLRGIVYLSHIIHNGKLKFYRYIQLRLSFHAQFPLDDLVLNYNPLLAAVKCPDPKKLISQFYTMLTLPQTTTSAYALKSRWEGEVGSMEDTEWSDALNTCKLVSPKLSDRLTQAFITHRAYLTHPSESLDTGEANLPIARCAVISFIVAMP